ncbi:MAG: hypothetical protein ACLFVX_05475 [Archaeoglobaceae archaeon]
MGNLQVGKSGRLSFKPEEDLLVTHEIIQSIIKLAEIEAEYEFTGYIRRNEGRYNAENIPDYYPVIEYASGKAPDMLPLRSEDPRRKMQYFDATLNFRTSPNGLEPSLDDFLMFNFMRQSRGATYHALVGYGRMLLFDLSDVSMSDFERCTRYKSTYEVSKCLTDAGMEQYEVDGSQDVVIKRAFHNNVISRAWGRRVRLNE